MLSLLVVSLSWSVNIRVLNNDLNIYSYEETFTYANEEATEFDVSTEIYGEIRITENNSQGEFMLILTFVNGVTQYKINDLSFGDTMIIEELYYYENTTKKSLMNLDSDWLEYKDRIYVIINSTIISDTPSFYLEINYSVRDITKKVSSTEWYEFWEPDVWEFTIQPMPPQQESAYMITEVILPSTYKVKKTYNPFFVIDYGNRFYVANDNGPLDGFIRTVEYENYKSNLFSIPFFWAFISAFLGSISGVLLSSFFVHSRKVNNVKKEVSHMKDILDIMEFVYNQPNKFGKKELESKFGEDKYKKFHAFVSEVANRDAYIGYSGKDKKIYLSYKGIKEYHRLVQQQTQNKMNISTLRTSLAMVFVTWIIALVAIINIYNIYKSDIVLLTVILIILIAVPGYAILRYIKGLDK